MMKDLKNILLEAISRTTIFEMAYNRQEYLYRVMGLYKQIVENWCLIKYCNIYDVENYNRLHWSKELIAHLENLYDCKLSKGIDKLKTTQFGLEYKAELDDENVICKLLYRKWKDENLPENAKHVVAKEFVNALSKICEIVSGKDPEKIENYVYKEI